MGWRFRKSVKILPGVRLNFGKKGISSVTVGGKYAKANISSRGTYNTYSLPGTGLSYRTKASGGSGNAPVHSNQSDQSQRVDWYCQKCYTGNPPELSVCRNCAREFLVNNEQPSQRLGANDGRNLGILVCVIAGSVLFLGVISAIFNPNTRTNYSTSSYTPQPTQNVIKQDVPNIPNIQKNPEMMVQKQSVKEEIPKSPNVAGSKNSAVVISENANLRQTPNSAGEVIQTLPAGEKIQVLKQKGAWFYVSASSVKGWMHGNTIKYVAADSADSTTASTDDDGNSTIVYSSPSYTPDSGSTYSGSSYSSSYDGRPKTVSVRGYFRSNGTYVAPYMRRAPRRR